MNAIQWRVAFCQVVVAVLFVWAACSTLEILFGSDKKLQNEAIQKGYAEIRVVDGERKFQWK